MNDAESNNSFVFQLSRKNELDVGMQISLHALS